VVLAVTYKLLEAWVVKTGIQVFFNGSPLPRGQCLDPGACPGPDPGFTGVTAQETFYEIIKFC
jgi:hypothetical protein